MADCDANYLRLMNLFPGIDREDMRQIGLCHGAEMVLNLTVIERTRYTTLMSLRQEASADLASRWMSLPVMTVRLYHDAKAAEVISYERIRGVRSRYEYPNNGMYQQDEKAQWNRFLGDWLSHCLNNGYNLEPLFEATP